MIDGIKKKSKRDMNNLQIKKRIKKIFEKVECPYEFTKELHKILESESEKKRFAQIERIIPDAYKIKVFGTKHPVLNLTGDQVGRYGEKNPKRSLEVTSVLWNNGSFEERIIAAKSLERIGRVDYKATLNMLISFSKDI